jgi:hypothetical protein
MDILKEWLSVIGVLFVWLVLLMFPVAVIVGYVAIFISIFKIGS